LLKNYVQIKCSLHEESGVREFWIVDPLTKVAEVFKLENGKFIRVGAFIETT